MKSFFSLVMVLLLATGMVHLAVAQYSGTMNTKLLYGVAKEVRSGVHYGMITVGEGIQSPRLSLIAARTVGKAAPAKYAKTPCKSCKGRTRRARAYTVRYAQR